jgi:HEPN domain
MEQPTDIRDRILQEFRGLISDCRGILKACGYRETELTWRIWPGDDDYLRIRTRALNLARRACGEDSDHFQSLFRLAKKDERDPADSQRLPECLGILEAAETDFAGGLLLNLKALVQAEALGDFLEQAESLLSAGYYVPAASLGGAVLEDGLRKLCDAKGIAYPAKTKIDALNSELAKAGTYDKLLQKRITALADIRNNADHGHVDKFKRQDVDDMLKWVRRFLADYLK